MPGLNINIQMANLKLLQKNIFKVVAVLDPNNTKLQRLIYQTAASRHTAEKRIFPINADIEYKLQNDLKNSTAFSLVLDKSTNLQLDNWLYLLITHVLILL